MELKIEPMPEDDNPLRGARLQAGDNIKIKMGGKELSGHVRGIKFSDPIEVDADLEDGSRAKFQMLELPDQSVECRLTVQTVPGPAFKTEAEARAAIPKMNGHAYGRLRDNYYKASCGLASLIEELRDQGAFPRELEELRKVAKDFDRASGNLSAGL